MNEIKKGIFAILLLTILTGIVYPLTVTFINQLLFPKQANGSMVEINGKIVGSELIAQKFESNRYFMPRQSAINYDASTSGATNFAPSSKNMANEVKQNVSLFKMRFDIRGQQTIPMDMATSSGSGLDPDISVESAILQSETIAYSRNVKKEDIESLVRELSKGGFLTPARINVLLLNTELDRRFP